MRRYSPKWTKLRVSINMIIYLSSVAVSVVGVLFLQHFQQESLIIEKFGNYMTPTIIVGTIFFFLILQSSLFIANLSIGVMFPVLLHLLFICSQICTRCIMSYFRGFMQVFRFIFFGL